MSFLFPSAVRGVVRGAVHVAFGCLLLAAAFGACAARIADQSFDDRLRLGNADLVLNGVGLRSVAWLKGFAAALYLPAKAGAPADVLAQPGPKRLQIKMIIDVDTKEFIKAFDTSLQRNNTDAERMALKERVGQFNLNLEQIGKVRKGDVLNLDFIPATGLVVSVNGVVRGRPVAGADLYAGLLKIFLGERPVDGRLKAGLLGDPPP